MAVDFDGLRRSTIRDFNRVVRTLNSHIVEDEIHVTDTMMLARQIDDLRSDLVFLANLMSEKEGYSYLENVTYESLATSDEI